MTYLTYQKQHHWSLLRLRLILQLSEYYLLQAFYLSNAHTKEIIEEYLENVDEVFKLISLAIKKNNIKKLLKTSIRSDSFKRLTK